MSSRAYAENRCGSAGEAFDAVFVERLSGYAELVLSDGRRVLLRGVLLPHPSDDGRGKAGVLSHAAALHALKKLVVGKSVKLRSLKTPDRRGRVSAHIWVARADGHEPWVQGVLIQNGHGRVNGEEDRCASELLKLEGYARARRLGVWAYSSYRVYRAERPGPLFQRANSFQIVSGKVLDVAKTKSTTYLNFGSNWRTDVTVALRLRGYDAFELKGKIVRARGWLRLRNGPLIDVKSRQQIEVLE